MSKKKEEYILSLHLTPELVEALRVLAAAHQRSLHGETLWAVREYVARQQHERAKEPRP